MAVPAISPAVVRLHRRIGLGLRHDEVDTVAGLGPRAAADRLLDAVAGPDPWGDADYTTTAEAAPADRRQAALAAIAVWIEAMVTATAPTPEWLAWAWHGHFVSALPEVKNPQFMVEQIRLFRRLGRGSLGELTRAVTVDPAMLLYLDGNDSTGRAPNENYSRELLELFTIGVGNYTEDDVAAGALALSGWTVPRGSASAGLVGRRHDDTPRRYLGVDGVHDVETVVGAIERHPALGRFVAATVATQVLGPAAPDDAIERAADAFVSRGLSVDALLRSLVDDVLAGVDGGEIVSPPLLWYVAARRITGASPRPRDVLPHLQAAGQVPWLAPNVSGWPSGAAWNNAATLVARFDLAALIAAATPATHPALVAADHDALAGALGIATGWSGTTAAALDRLGTAQERLVLALVSPEFVNC